MDGGFLLSPPATSTVSSSIATPHLPHPRSQPLRPGGNKETAFIQHVDTRILHIQRRFAKRTTFRTSLNDVEAGIEDPRLRPAMEPWPTDVKGYASMKEGCRNISDLMDVIWVSGTPSLQVPYLLSLAMLLTSMVAGMPPSPKALFGLLNKLDLAFASLLQGRDVNSGETLPGFEGRRGVSGTEKVRIRSLVERTRIGVMEAMRSGEFEEEVPEEQTDDEKMDIDTDGELVLEGEEDEEEDEAWEMQLARVYDRTIVELGDSLEAPNIGIITEGRG